MVANRMETTLKIYALTACSEHVMLINMSLTVWLWEVENGLNLVG